MPAAFGRNVMFIVQLEPGATLPQVLVRVNLEAPVWPVALPMKVRFPPVKLTGTLPALLTTTDCGAVLTPRTELKVSEVTVTTNDPRDAN